MEDGYRTLLAEAEGLLDDVDRALGRLDDGTYDQCEVCGGPISTERLTDRPTARTCSAHTRLADQPRSDSGAGEATPPGAGAGSPAPGATPAPGGAPPGAPGAVGPSGLLPWERGRPHSID